MGLTFKCVYRTYDELLITLGGLLSLLLKMMLDSLHFNEMLFLVLFDLLVCHFKPPVFEAVNHDYSFRRVFLEHLEDQVFNCTARWNSLNQYQLVIDGK